MRKTITTALAASLAFTSANALCDHTCAGTCSSSSGTTFENCMINVCGCDTWDQWTNSTAPAVGNPIDTCIQNGKAACDAKDLDTNDTLKCYNDVLT